ncbi:MAG TPA: enoyl-CoA hydratase-related protein [Solirubrobacterales bacterium]|nr:enoyl-CoA hydratase-related protein [Solirubrobacterales bacterium]
MSDETVLTDVSDFFVATCRLNRPAVRNALSPELMDELATELEHLDSNDEVRAIVIAGSNDVFASGADIRSLSERSVQEALHHPTASFWKRLGAIRKPTVAAVSGWALGNGCELALACDMCVAAEGSQFGLPEITLGLIPGGGGTQRLARVIGKQRTMELVLTGRRYSAEQAAAWGLVNKLASRAEWLEQATDLAAETAARAPIATRLAKQDVLEAEQASMREALDTERELFELAMSTEDRIEGMEAFMQGRRPEFKGR